MKSIALATYTIEVRKKYGERDIFEPLADIGGSDLLPLFDEFLGTLDTPLSDSHAKTVMKVTKKERSGRNLFGLIETGVYGYTANVYDTKKNKIAHRQTKDQSGMTPFFFQAYIPDEGPNGVLSLQRFGNAGIRQIFATPMRDFFATKCPVFIGGAPRIPGSVVALDLRDGSHRILRQTTDLLDNPDLRIANYLTTVEPVEFPTANGLTAFGLFYPPFHPDVEAPADEKPPVVVKVHGGPTASASSILSLHNQFWTSRGIAVLDVNYGGSTGFGRAYRERLESQWGVVDVEDCINGVKHLASQGRVDAKRAVITGGSAGGYTALAALAFHDFFQGGASHYGVSDIAALARDTHKFESRYLDSLIGPYPQEEALYRERSPIHHVDRLSKPVIFFQGDEDVVVPPNQTEMMVNALRRNGNAVGYFLFAGEQHGFRQAANIQRSLDAELYFYAIEVFGTGLTF